MTVRSLCAENGDSSPYPVVQGKEYKFEKVAQGVYYTTGGVGSNNVVVVNDQDVLLVDNGTTPAAARALLADIQLLTNKPVRTVVNTHFHYDHTDGNSVFAPDVQIIGHEFIRHAILTFDVLNREPYRTSQGTRVPALVESLRGQIARETDPAKKAELSKNLAAAEKLREQLKEIKPTPPNVTYSDQLVLYKGSREIRLLFLGRGHTAGDTFVYLPKERIVCTGDMEEGSRIAYMGDGYFDEWVQALDKLKQLDFGLVLPGHGRPFSDKRIITAFQSYLIDLTTQVANLRQQGDSAEEAAKRVDMASHQKDFAEIKGPGADLRGVRHMYEWMNGREHADAAAEVLQFERDLEAAVVRGDVAYVDRASAPDLIFTHGDGWTTGGKPLLVDDKKSFLKRVENKQYNVRDLESVKVEMHGDSAITYGRYVAQNRIGDPNKSWFSVWFERVYEKRNGQWLYVSHKTVHGPTYGPDRQSVADK